MQLLLSFRALASSLCSDLSALSSRLVSNSISDAVSSSAGRNTFVCDSRVVCPFRAFFNFVFVPRLLVKVCNFVRLTNTNTNRAADDDDSIDSITSTTIGKRG